MTGAGAVLVGRPQTLPGVFVVKLLRGYKRFLSPLLPAACRFEPTCSVFATEAIERYGLVRGGRLTFGRLLRCHPFHPGGSDPVP
jgi:putative membrane protein insertion efficiency factor